MIVLALNSGSSSLKFGLFRIVKSVAESLLSETISTSDQREAMVHIAKLLADSGMPAPAAIGHRASNRAWWAEDAAALPH